MTDRHKPVGRRGLRRPAPEYSRGGRAGASQRRHLRALWLELAPDARFCSRCGAPREGASARREERKLVSILFVDLEGFTASSDNADPEDVRDSLSAYHAVARERIESYGGNVEKFIGDAVMAVFGAPVAHGDDAERAVRAGLRVLDAVAALGLGARGPGGGEHRRGDRPRRGGGGRSHRDRGRRQHGGPAADRRPRRPARGRGRDSARDAGTRSPTSSFPHRSRRGRRPPSRRGLQRA